MINEEQILATDPSYSIWLNAGAGTGKTKVLVDRVLRIILSKIQWHKILCLTFTNAAADEMLERLVRSLEAWSRCDYNQRREILYMLLNRFPTDDEIDYAAKCYELYKNDSTTLRVYTIHSFCQYILHSFPIEACISPNFTVIDDVQQKNLVSVLQDKVLSMQSCDSVIYFIKQMSVFDFNDLICKIVERRSKFRHQLRSFNNTESYTKYICDKFNISKVKYDSYSFDDEILNLLKNQNEVEVEVDDNKDRAFFTSYNKYIKELNCLCNKTRDLLATEEHFELYKNLFLTKANTKRKRILSRNTCAKYPEVYSYILDIQSKVDVLCGLAKTIKIIDFSVQLFNLSKITLDTYQQIKDKQEVLDYDDLIFHTQNLLTVSNMKDWVLYKLDGGISHILLDEAQDTSLEQWEIIDALIEDFFAGSSNQGDTKTIFIVGDEKQSIYSFQGAELINFQYFRNKISNLAYDANTKFAYLDLKYNYRSTQKVLNSVSKVFSYLQSDVSYNFINSQVSLQCFRAYNNVDGGNCFSEKDGCSKFFCVTDVDTNAKENSHIQQYIDSNTLDIKSQMAKHIAKYISSRILDSKILPSTQTTAQSKDFMILVRKRTSFISILNHELSKVGILTNGYDKFSIRENMAILDIIALAKFVIQPYDNLNLACLLKSPICQTSIDNKMVQISDNDLGILSQGSKSIWYKLSNSSDVLYMSIFEMLSSFINISANLNARDFFYTFLETFGLKSKIAKTSEDLYALNKIMSAAYQFSLNQCASLQSFIWHFEESAINVKQNVVVGDHVSILTVHGAKGLQSPIVIIADCDSNKTPHEMFIEDKDGVILWNFSVENSNDHLIRTKEYNANKIMQENLRLLYVAMTRAEDELVFFGVDSDINSTATDRHRYSWSYIYSLIFDPIQLNTSDLNWKSKTDTYTNSINNIDALSLNYNNINDQNRLLSDVLNDRSYVPYSSDDMLIDRDAQDNEIKNILESYSKIQIGIMVHNILEDIVGSSKEYSDVMIKNHPLFCRIDDHIVNNLKNSLRNVLNLPLFTTDKKYEIKKEFGLCYYDNSSEPQILRIDLLVIFENVLYIIDYKFSDKTLTNNTNTNTNTNTTSSDHYYTKDAPYESDFTNLYGTNMDKKDNTPPLQGTKIYESGSDFLFQSIKTYENRAAPPPLYDSSGRYVEQLNLYEKAVSKIYPNHLIYKYVLWLSNCKLMKVS